MAHKTEGDCPLTVNAIIRKRAKDEGISLRKMVIKTSQEIGIPEDTIQKWVWPRPKSAAKNGSTLAGLYTPPDRVAQTCHPDKDPKPNQVPQTGHPDKDPQPEEVQTPADIKAVVEDFREAIERNEIAEEDLKPILDVVSGKIATNKLSTKVSENVANVHQDKVGRTKPTPAKKKKSLVERVTNSFMFVASHMDAVLGKGPEALSAKDKRMLNNEVRRALPYFLRTLLHMGVDLENVVKEALHDYRKEMNRGANREDYRRLEK